MNLRAGVFYDGTLAEPRHNVDIEIADGKIATIRPAAEGAKCDRSAACVTPGLVNAHVHLEMNGEPDTMGALAMMNQNQRMLAAVASARRSLEAGVTTVRDVGSSFGIGPAIRDAIDSGKIEGPRMRAAGAILCMTGGHGWFVGRQVDGPWDARKGVREQLAAGADCIKLVATGGVLTKGAVPGNAQLLPEELTAAIDEAHRHGLRVAAHAIGTEGIKNALRSGIDSIEHGHLLDDEAIALFKERNVYLVPTLTAPTCILEHAHEGRQPAFVIKKAEALAERMRENLRHAFQQGVKFAGGSDAGTPYNYHENYAYEVELMHTLLGMSPQQALNAATAVASDLIAIQRGVLQGGEAADLLLLDADITRDIKALARPLAVMKGGAFVGSAA